MGAKNGSLGDLIAYIVQPDPDVPQLSWGSFSLKVNLSGLKAEPEMLASARLALDAWTTATGIVFSEVAKGADIGFTTDTRFDSNGDGTLDADFGGAFADFEYSLPDGTLTSAIVHVAEDWMDGFPADERWGIGDYGMQTFIHEIGHALGLDHPGPYNASGGDEDETSMRPSYERDAIFAKDTVQYTVMSYFDQDAFGDASVVNLATPAIADIAAIERLYGPLSVNPGNTVYGAGGVFDFSEFAAFTISDSGGLDTIDLRDLGFGARLDLNPGAFSDIEQRIDGLAIALDTVIERASGTSFEDAITGNAVANLLKGQGGDDAISGGKGDDTLSGGAGADRLSGGKGGDVFLYARASEITGDFVLDFASGSDRIGLSAIDADATARKNQAFDFIGRDDFGENAGELRTFFKGRDTFLAGDVDGDGEADFTLRLDRKIALTDDDLIA